MIDRTCKILARLLLAGSLCLVPVTAAWSAVTYVSTGVPTLANNNVSSVQINNPTGLAVGDLMLAFVSQNNPGSPIVSSATGWTSVLTRTYTNGTDTVGTSVYYRFATAADISNGSFTFSFTSSRRSAGAIMAFRGVDTVSPINASGSQGNASSTSLTAPSITTLDRNTMLVAYYSFVQGSNSATPPTGMTEAFDIATGAGPNGLTVEGGYGSQAAVGATGTKVATAASASVNIGALVALSPAATTLAEYRFDELSWSGTASDVLDSTGNGYNATARAGASTATGSPAYTSGTQSTCRYGYFDHTGVTLSYVQLPASLPKMDGSYSVAAWIRSPSPNTQQQRIFANDDSDDGWGLSLADGTSGGIRLFNRNVNFTTMSGQGAGSGGVILQTPNNIVAANTWYYVAATVNTVTRQAKIYVYDTSGTQRALTTGTYTGTWCASGTCSGATAIGGETSSSTEGQQTGFHFLGNIDEARMYQGALTQTMIESILPTVRTCPSGAPDHLQIEYPGDGLTCTHSTVTVKACANSTCSTLYAGGVTGTLAPGGAAFTIGSSGLTTSTVSSTSTPAALSATSTPATVNALTCLNTVTSSTSCSMAFNNAGFIFAASAGGVSTNIANQVAGTSSATYYLRAVQTNTSTKACEAALVGGNSVNMAYQCNNPTTCSGTNLMSINGGTATIIARNDNAGVTTYTAVPMTFDANGNAPFTLNYSDVGQVTLFANRAAGATSSGTLLSALSGSSNAFVVKPGGFLISNVRQTAAPFLLNPAATGVGGNKFVAAGEAFTATVTATTSTGTATPNYGRELVPEGVLLTPSLVLPSTGGNLGTVANASIGGAGIFSNGAVTVSNLSWSEVGILALTPSVADGDYLGAGSATGTSSGNIGRFIPHHFDVTVTQACPAGSFTYSGQPFPVQVTAMNGLATPGKTLNYDGSAATSPNFARNVTLSEVNGVAGTLAPSSVALASFTSGVANATPAFSFTVNPSAPGTIAVRAVDADGVTSNGFAEGTVVIRSGRLRMANAYGSELLTLPMPLEAQYWHPNGYFTRNVDDSCTVVPMPSIMMGNYVGQLNACETQLTPVGNQTLVAGRLAGAGLVLTAPGAGNSGSVDLTLNTGNVAAGLTCVAAAQSAATAGNLPWLGPNPTARATFGIYRSRLIYSRENY